MNGDGWQTWENNIKAEGGTIREVDNGKGDSASSITGVFVILWMDELLSFFAFLFLICFSRCSSTGSISYTSCFFANHKTPSLCIMLPTYEPI